MSRGTILYVGGFELPDGNAAAQRVLANALIFRDLGYRVGLVGVTRRQGALALGRTPDFDVAGVEAWEVPYPSGQSAWLRRTVGIGEVQAVVAAMGAGADLRAIIAYNHPAVAQWRLLRYARSLGGHGIADVTEWYGDVRNDSVAGVVKNLDGRLRMGWVNRRMDGLITTSPFISEHYAATGAPIVELPTLMDEPPGQAAAPATPDGQPKRLFFAGTGFDPAVLARTRDGLKDRLDLVIERLAGAADRGAAFELDAYGLTGADYRALRPDHAPLLERLGGRVRFHGRRPRDEVRRALREADYSIFLRDESRVTLAGFPSKYSESVALGTPVLTNPMPNILRYHQPDRSGRLIDRDDPARGEAQLAEALAVPAREIQAMKDFCARSGMFHYRSFLDSVADFMNRVD